MIFAIIKIYKIPMKCQLCVSNTHACICRDLPMTPTGPVCLYGLPSDTLHWCVNALTTCPDVEVETFGDAAPQDFTTSHDFCASVEIPLFFCSHLVPFLSSQRSNPQILSGLVSKMRHLNNGQTFYSYIFYHCLSLCIKFSSAAIRSVVLCKKPQCLLMLCSNNPHCIGIEQSQGFSSLACCTFQKVCQNVSLKRLL